MQNKVVFGGSLQKNIRACSCMAGFKIHNAVSTVW